MTGPSIHVIRARKLLVGGLVGGLAAAVLSLVLFTVLDGTRGLASAALAAAMVLFFYGVGQLVMVAFADAGARTLLAVSMASYTARVVVLGLVLLVYNKNAEAFPALWPMAIFLTTIARGDRAGSRSRSGCSTGCGSASTTPSTSRRPPTRTSSERRTARRAARPAAEAVAAGC